MTVEERMKSLKERRGDVTTSREKEKRGREFRRLELIQEQDTENIRKKAEEIKSNISSLEKNLNTLIREKVNIENQYINASENYNRQANIYNDEKQRALAFNRSGMQPQEIQERINSIEAEYERKIQQHLIPMENAKKAKKEIDSKINSVKSNLYNEIDNYSGYVENAKQVSSEMKKQYEDQIASQVEVGTSWQREREDLITSELGAKLLETKRRESDYRPEGYEQLPKEAQEEWLKTGQISLAPTEIVYDKGKVTKTYDYKRETVDVPTQVGVGLLGEPIIVNKTVPMLYKEAQKYKELQKAEQQQIYIIEQDGVKVPVSAEVFFKYNNIGTSPQETLKNINKTGENIKPTGFIDYSPKDETNVTEEMRKEGLITSTQTAYPIPYYTGKTDASGQPITKTSYMVIEEGGITEKATGLLSPLTSTASTIGIIKDIKEKGLSLETLKSSLLIEPSVKTTGGEITGIGLDKTNYGLISGISIPKLTLKSDTPLITGREKISKMYESFLTQEEKDKLKAEQDLIGQVQEQGFGIPAKILTGVSQFGGLGTGLETISLSLQTGKLVSPSAVWELEKRREAEIVYGLQTSTKPSAIFSPKISLTEKVEDKIQPKYTMDWGTFKGTEQEEVFKYAGTRGIEAGLLASTVILPYTKGIVPKSTPYFGGKAIGEVGSKGIDYYFKGMIVKSGYETAKSPTLENISGLASLGIFSGGMKVGKIGAVKGRETYRILEKGGIKEVPELFKELTKDYSKKGLPRKVKTIDKAYTKYPTTTEGKPSGTSFGKLELEITKKLDRGFMTMKGIQKSILKVGENIYGQVSTIDILSRNVKITKPKVVKFKGKKIVIEPTDKVGELRNKLKEIGMSETEIADFFKREEIVEGFNKTEYHGAVSESTTFEPYRQFGKAFYEPKTKADVKKLKLLEKELKARSVFGKISEKSLMELGVFYQKGNVIYVKGKPVGLLTEGKPKLKIEAEKGKSPIEIAKRLKDEGKIEFLQLSSKEWLKEFGQDPSLGIHGAVEMKRGSKIISEKPLIAIRTERLKWTGKKYEPTNIKIDESELQISARHELTHYGTPRLNKIRTGYEKMKEGNLKYLTYRLQPNEIVASLSEPVEKIRQKTTGKDIFIDLPVKNRIDTQMFVRFPVKSKAKPSASYSHESKGIADYGLSKEQKMLINKKLGIPTLAGINIGELTVAPSVKVKTGKSKSRIDTIGKDINLEKTIMLSKQKTSTLKGIDVIEGITEVTLKDSTKVTKQKQIKPDRELKFVKEIKVEPKINTNMEMKFDKKMSFNKEFGQQLALEEQQKQVELLDFENKRETFGEQLTKKQREFLTSVQTPVIIPEQIRGKFKIKQKQSIQPVTIIKSNQINILKPAIKQVQKQTSKSQEIPDLLSVTKPAMKEITSPAIKSISKLSELSVTKPAIKQAQKQAQKTQIITTTTTKVRPPIPPTIIKPALAMKFGRETQAQQQLTEASYAVYIKRFGKWILIDDGLTKNEAIELGRDKVKSGLGATFKIEKQAKRIKKKSKQKQIELGKEFRPYKIEKGRKIGLKDTWIQVRPMRLGTKGERIEIQKERKLMKIKSNKLKLW